MHKLCFELIVPAAFQAGEAVGATLHGVDGTRIGAIIKADKPSKYKLRCEATMEGQHAAFWVAGSVSFGYEEGQHADIHSGD